MTWRDDLDWSNGSRVSPVWDAAYKSLFPKSRIERPVRDQSMQIQGVEIAASGPGVTTSRPSTRRVGA